jgi:dihydroxy-acid dehydratase
VIQPVEKPVFPRGHLRILAATSRPTARSPRSRQGRRAVLGPAKVFDSEEAMLDGLEKGEIAKGSVVVIRY